MGGKKNYHCYSLQSQTKNKIKGKDKLLRGKGIEACVKQMAVDRVKDPLFNGFVSICTH